MVDYTGAQGGYTTPMAPGPTPSLAGPAARPQSGAMQSWMQLMARRKAAMPVRAMAPTMNPNQLAGPSVPQNQQPSPSPWQPSLADIAWSQQHQPIQPAGEARQPFVVTQAPPARPPVMGAASAPQYEAGTTPAQMAAQPDNVGVGVPYRVDPSEAARWTPPPPAPPANAVPKPPFVMPSGPADRGTPPVGQAETPTGVTTNPASNTRAPALNQWGGKAGTTNTAGMQSAWDQILGAGTQPLALYTQARAQLAQQGGLGQNDQQNQDSIAKLMLSMWQQQQNQGYQPTAQDVSGVNRGVAPVGQGETPPPQSYSPQFPAPRPVGFSDTPQPVPLPTPLPGYKAPTIVPPGENQVGSVPQTSAQLQQAMQDALRRGDMASFTKLQIQWERAPR